MFTLMCRPTSPCSVVIILVFGNGHANVFFQHRVHFDVLERTLSNMFMSTKTPTVINDVAKIGISYNGGKNICQVGIEYSTCQYGSSNKALKRCTPVQWIGLLFAPFVPPRSRYDCRHAAYLMTSDPETV
jgi:hypothetical protein